MLFAAALSRLSLSATKPSAYDYQQLPAVGQVRCKFFVEKSFVEDPEMFCEAPGSLAASSLRLAVSAQ